MPDDVSLALDVRAALGECPLWSVRGQELVFVDIKGQALHRFSPASGAPEITPMPEEIGCVGLAPDGYVAGLRSGIWLLDRAGTPTRQLAENPEPTGNSRFNDGRVDPAGRFLAGTLDEAKTSSSAHLYRLDRRGLQPLVGGLLTSNGLAFSPDGRILYHADTPRFTVWAYDYDVATGEVAGKRVFITLDPDAPDRARPDGAAVDAEGCYWCALYEGGRIARFDPAGHLMGEFAVPARCPTMVAFGGPDLTTLYITSARAGRPEDELASLPHSGGLFALETGIKGRAEPIFDPAV